jgi:hypothetical protein
MHQSGPAFVLVFAAEGLLFLAAAALAARLDNPSTRPEPVPGVAASPVEFGGARS